MSLFRHFDNGEAQAWLAALISLTAMPEGRPWP